MAPNITVYFLQASRSIRTAWQLEELGLDYKVEFADRENQKAPQAFKDASGDGLGKFPTIKDGDVVVAESGAIAEYLEDNYDPEHKLLPTDKAKRAQVQRWVHAAEGTYALHALAVLYTRWFGEPHKEAIDQIVEKMSVNVIKDLDFLEKELAKSSGKFLVGDKVTIADIMMLFTIQFIFARELGTQGKTWKGVERWVGNCEGTDAYQRAVKKTGHKL